MPMLWFEPINFPSATYAPKVSVVSFSTKVGVMWLLPTESVWRHLYSNGVVSRGMPSFGFGPCNSLRQSSGIWEECELCCRTGRSLKSDAAKYNLYREEVRQKDKVWCNSSINEVRLLCKDDLDGFRCQKKQASSLHQDVWFLLAQDSTFTPGNP